MGTAIGVTDLCGNAEVPARRKTLVSFVVPVFNEADCLPDLYTRARDSADGCGVAHEMIFVDDGSTDASLSFLRGLHERDRRVRVIVLSRNFGHQAAIMAGLHYTRGDCTLVMDGDLQDPPELLAPMLDRWRQGCHVVFGIRRRRKEGWIKKCCYSIFYRLLHRLSSLRIPRDAGDFCLMDRRVVDEIKRLREDRPFVRGFRSWVGFRQSGIEYDRPGREKGQTKYNMTRLIGLALDGWLSYSEVFLRVSTFLGLLISTASIAYGMYIVTSLLLASAGLIQLHRVPSGWSSLACFITFLFGIQFIFLGILAEYIGRTFIQVKQRPVFVIDETVGVHEQADINQHHYSCS